MNGNSKLAAVISYITWIGWIVAFFIGDRNDEFVRQHINQALILNIVSVISGAIGRLGGIFSFASGLIGLVILVLLVLGIYKAATGDKTPLPVIGDFRII